MVTITRMADLFDHIGEEAAAAAAPLADRMRPRWIDEMVGQQAIIGPGTLLRSAITRDDVFSVILWGPPGTGKTTLARVIAAETKSAFVGLSGVTSSKDDLLTAVAQAKDRLKFNRQRTILFVDEIHRWNKAQQDALLPHVEHGTVTLIGATTENPSFEVIGPLLSRCRVLVMERLRPDDLGQLLDRALHDAPRGLGDYRITLEAKARELLMAAANGDARAMLTAVEIAAKAAGPGAAISAEKIAEVFQRPQLLHDKGGEEHYNIISAFIKSMRGSDPDATVYWLARLMEAGEDPLFVARRMVIFASEDIGVADVHALPLAIACMQACDMVGLPECTINLSHTAVYLATAKKSNATYVAYGKAVTDVQTTLNAPVPLHLRNAPTKLMKDLGYHAGYKYSHDYAAESGRQQYLPDELEGRTYYEPPT